MKRIFKITGFILTAITVLTALSLTIGAEYENTHVNTGDSLEDIIAVAETQLGYMEGSLEGTVQKTDDVTKYGEWYGMNGQPWCAMFVSWCADQAGIPTTVVPKHASCDVGMQWFINKGQFEYGSAYGGTYEPKRGDIVYFGYQMASGDFDSNHVGIVYKVENSKIYVYEGNSSAKVQSVSYRLGITYILGFGQPQYNTALDIPTGYYTVNTAWLNFRAEPNTSAERYELLPMGTLLYVTEVSENGWGRTEYNGKEGWLSLEYCKRAYRISYKAEEATEVPEPQYKSHKSDISLTTLIPKGASGEFLGWALAPNTEVVYLPGDTYSEDKDITLYAVWSDTPIVASYTVSYDANGGTNAPAEQIKLENKELTLSLDKPVLKGYEFLGWATEKEGAVSYTPGSVYKENADVVLYAQWRLIPLPEKYTVTYNGMGAESTPEAQTKEENKELILTSQLPVYKGYEFVGWAITEKGNAVYQPGDKYTENKSITLYAVWKPVAVLGEYTVAYNANMGTNAPAAQKKLENEDITISASIPVRGGYTFEGWALTKDAEWADIFPGDSYTDNKSITLYALWARELDTVTVLCGEGGRFLRSVSEDKLSIRIIADNGNAISRVSVNNIPMPLIGDTLDTIITVDYSLDCDVEIVFTDNSKLWINPYTDVPDDQWYYDAVHFCYKEGIMKGTTPTTFAPSKTLTRAEFVTILGRIYENEGGVIACNGNLPFTDVKDTQYFYTYLCWAYNNKVVAGVSETKFSPAAVLTREQMCMMLYNYASYKSNISQDFNKTVIYAFKDNEDISSWAKTAVAWAVNERYISGYKSKLTPKEAATRAQAATVIMKYFKENL